jgi:hypothetical protein
MKTFNKKRILKKCLSLILSLIMIFTIISPISVLAIEPSESITEEQSVTAIGKMDKLINELCCSNIGNIWLID